MAVAIEPIKFFGIYAVDCASLAKTNCEPDKLFKRSLQLMADRLLAGPEVWNRLNIEVMMLIENVTELIPNEYSTVFVRSLTCHILTEVIQ